MELEILGSPKTVRLVSAYRGKEHSAPLECWVAALVEVLTPEQKERFFGLLEHTQVTKDYQKIAKARVVADIPMPNLRG